MPAAQSKSSANRGGARQANHAGHAAGEQRGTREGVRSAAGGSHDREPIDAERVGQLGDVVRRTFRSTAIAAA
jgi:hypothetical protein